MVIVRLQEFERGVRNEYQGFMAFREGHPEDCITAVTPDCVKRAWLEREAARRGVPADDLARRVRFELG